jgi:hypothetical protein
MVRGPQVSKPRLKILWKLLVCIDSVLWKESRTSNKHARLQWTRICLQFINGRRVNVYNATYCCVTYGTGITLLSVAWHTFCKQQLGVAVLFTGVLTSWTGLLAA